MKSKTVQSLIDQEREELLQERAELKFQLFTIQKRLGAILHHLNMLKIEELHNE